MRHRSISRRPRASARIFSAWTKATYEGREIDFWNLAERSGRVSHERVVSVEQLADRVVFEVDLLYQILKEPAVDVLRERWKVTVYNSSEDHYCFDIVSTQTALTDKPLVLEQYIYGGQAYRGPVAWLDPSDDYAKSHPGLKSVPAEMLTSEGAGRKDGNHSHVKWVAISGPAVSENGEIVEGNAQGALAVLSHASNFRFRKQYGCTQLSPTLSSRLVSMVLSSSTNPKSIAASSATS